MNVLDMLSVLSLSEFWRRSGIIYEVRLSRNMCTWSILNFIFCWLMTRVDHCLHATCSIAVCEVVLQRYPHLMHSNNKVAECLLEVPWQSWLSSADFRLITFTLTTFILRINEKSESQETSSLTHLFLFLFCL